MDHTMLELYQSHGVLPRLSSHSSRIPSLHLQCASFSYARDGGRCLRPLQFSSPAIVQLQVSETAGETPALQQKAGRSVVRLGLPSKGRMAEGTLNLLEGCELAVHKPNPRQYIASIPSLPGLEVWFQREADVVRKIRTGDVDLGIVGYDTVCEYGQGDEDLIVVHDALDFGACYLTIAIPTYGIFTNVSSVAELVAMPMWSDQRPLRIASSFQYLGKKFIQSIGLKHVQLLTADGALEAAPAMGIADAILDLVGSGITLRENSLKEIDGGVLLKSQGVLVASRYALLHRETALEKTHEILERIEAHLRARSQYTVIAHMRGKSMEDVAEVILNATDFHGLQGPTISPVFSKAKGMVNEDYYAVVVCVAKSHLYDAVKQLRQVGGSGVLVSPLTYIFDEEPPRWQQLLNNLRPS